MTDTTIVNYLDFANHHANATPDDIKKLCAQVLEYNFHAAFVNPCYVALARLELQGKKPVGTAIAFPLGQDTLEVKLAACRQAVTDGAGELDLVSNMGYFLSDEALYLKEMREVVNVVHGSSTSLIVKFIIETGYLLPDDPKLPESAKTKGREAIKQAATLVKESGADYVKICSGMGPRGANVEDVNLVREAVGKAMMVKVAGGISTHEEAKAFIAAGVTRIGTSKAIDIVTQKPTTEPKSSKE